MRRQLLDVSSDNHRLDRIEHEPALLASGGSSTLRPPWLPEACGVELSQGKSQSVRAHAGRVECVRIDRIIRGPALRRMLAEDLAELVGSVEAALARRQPRRPEGSGFRVQGMFFWTQIVERIRWTPTPG